MGERRQGRRRRQRQRCFGSGTSERAIAHSVTVRRLYFCSRRSGTLLACARRAAAPLLGVVLGSNSAPVWCMQVDSETIGAAAGLFSLLQRVRCAAAPHAQQRGKGAQGSAPVCCCGAAGCLFVYNRCTLCIAGSWSGQGRHAGCEQRHATGRPSPWSRHVAATSCGVPCRGAAEPACGTCQKLGGLDQLQLILLQCCA